MLTLPVTLSLGLAGGSHAEYTEPPGLDAMAVHTFANEAGGDSQRLQSLIDEVSSSGGGVIRLDDGGEAYTLAGVRVTSDTHLRLGQGVRIRQDATIRNANVFSLFGENISIVGEPGDNPPVIVAVGSDAMNPDQSSFRAVLAMEVKNFRLASFRIEETDTRFSTLMTKSTAVDGTIEDIVMTGAGPGWGLLQMQGGVNILAQRLDGQGGFTLRLEQGSADDPVGIQDLRANHIIGRHGRAAVLIAPKNHRNGHAVIEHVTSYGCQWAVAAGSGKGDGVFESVTLKGRITAHYDDHGSQFRTLSRKIKAIPFLPPALQERVSTIPGYGRDKFTTGPAFGAVKHGGMDWVIIDKAAVIERRGFPFHDPDVVLPDYYADTVEKNGER